jgi:hypothetical protein
MKPVVKILLESWLYDGNDLSIYVIVQVKNWQGPFDIGEEEIGGDGQYDLYFHHGASPLKLLTSLAKQIGFEIEDGHKLKEKIFCLVERNEGKKKYHTICASLKEATTIARCIAKSTCIPVPGFEVHVVGTDGENVYDGVIDASKWIYKDPVLKLNDRVIMRNTNSSDLDGKFGTLMGIASQHEDNTFWIVELDEPLVDRRAIVLTDSCLEHHAKQGTDSWKLKYR